MRFKYVIAIFILCMLASLVYAEPIYLHQLRVNNTYTLFVQNGQLWITNDQLPQRNITIDKVGRNSIARDMLLPFPIGLMLPNEKVTEIFSNARVRAAKGGHILEGDSLLGYNSSQGLMGLFALQKSVCQDNVVMVTSDFCVTISGSATDYQLVEYNTSLEEMAVENINTHLGV